MAKYHYDEAGNMAAYFLLTFLALILTPLTLSLLSSQSIPVSPLSSLHLILSIGISLDGCYCKPCLDKRKRSNPFLKSYLSKKLPTFISPHFWISFSPRSYLLVIGWSLFGYISYKVANATLDNKVYDPFEILGIRTVSPGFPLLTMCVDIM